MNLSIIADEIATCVLCPLHKDPGKSVPGEGNENADLMFIGEAPGATESVQGRPFVGRAGKLLDNMIKSLELSREDVFIANICKHRPPNNRKPTGAEMQLCIPFLYRQIGIIKPRTIVALGNTALEGLTGYGSISKRCGEWEFVDIDGQSIAMMPCYHPSALLRNPKWKVPAWNAMQKVKAYLETNNE
jgi:uracil-DNA glycosylase